MAIGTLIKTIQGIMRKDAGVDGDAQRISQGRFRTPEQIDRYIQEEHNSWGD